MFENIGGKIKTLAKVVCWIGIIVSCIYGLLIMAKNEGLILAGLIIIIIGILCSWVGSFTLYGFGQLIENSDKIANSLNPSTSASDATDTREEEFNDINPQIPGPH